MPHSAHLGVEAVGFAEVPLADGVVSEHVSQSGAKLVEVGLKARTGLLDKHRGAGERRIDLASGVSLGAREDR